MLMFALRFLGTSSDQFGGRDINDDIMCERCIAEM